MTANKKKPRAKRCPATGSACQHACDSGLHYAGYCWADIARRANEPEGRDTGLHRDSMG